MAAVTQDAQCIQTQPGSVRFYSIHWVLTKTTPNTQAPNPGWFFSFFPVLWDPKFNDKLFITDPTFSPGPAVSQEMLWLRFPRRCQALSVAPVTPVFVCNCCRQMSENHPLTDLRSSISETPSAPTPKSYHTCGWKHSEAKCTRPSQVHAKLRHGIAMASRLPALPPLCFLINPGLLRSARFPGLLSSQDLERRGPPGFWNKIKRSLLQLLWKNSTEETWLAGRKTGTCLLENHSCVIFFLHWSLPDYHSGQPAN